MGGQLIPPHITVKQSPWPSVTCTLCGQSAHLPCGRPSLLTASGHRPHVPVPAKLADNVTPLARRTPDSYAPRRSQSVLAAFAAWHVHAEIPQFGEDRETTERQVRCA